MPVTQKTRFGGNPLPDVGQRFVAAGGGDAIRLPKQHLLQMRAAAAPFGNFQAGAELVVSIVQRMREQTRQEGRAAGTFYKLRRPRQQPKHDAQENRVGNPPGGDVHEQFRPGDQRGTPGFLFRAARAGTFQTLRMAEVLHQQGVQILTGQLLEKTVQPAASVPAEKPVAIGPSVSASLRNG